MKTIKILTIIGGLMLLSATAFSQEPEKKDEPKSETYAYNPNKHIEYNAEYFELREAFHNLRELANKLAEELKYNANEFVKEELQEEQLNN